MISLFEVILTQTVGQMTDAIRLIDFATQTARPQTFLSFLNENTNKINTKRQDLDNLLYQNEQKLRQQLIDLDEINEKLRSSHPVV